MSIQATQTLPNAADLAALILPNSSGQATGAPDASPFDALLSALMVADDATSDMTNADGDAAQAPPPADIFTNLAQTIQQAAGTAAPVSNLPADTPLPAADDSNPPQSSASVPFQEDRAVMQGGSGTQQGVTIPLPVAALPEQTTTAADSTEKTDTTASTAPPPGPPDQNAALRVRAAAAYAEAATLNDAAAAEDASGAEPSATDAVDEIHIRAALQKPISLPKNTAATAKPDSKPLAANPESDASMANVAAQIAAPLPAPAPPEAAPQATDPKTTPEIAVTDSSASRPAQASQPVPAADSQADKPPADSASAPHAMPAQQSAAAAAAPALPDFVKAQLAPSSPRVSTGPAAKPDPAANSGKTASAGTAKTAPANSTAANSAAADSTSTESASKDAHSAEPQASGNSPVQTAPTPQHMPAHPSLDAAATPALQTQIAANAAGIDAPVHVEVRTLAGQTQASADLNDLAFRIAAKSEAGESEFTLRLDPPDLGGIEVKLHVDAQGQAQASLTADKPQTLDLLQRDAGVLERTLKDAGLDLGGGLSFSLKSDGEPGQWRAPDQAPMRRAEIAAVESGNAAAAVLAVTAANGWGGQTRLDIRI